MEGFELEEFLLVEGKVLVGGASPSGLDSLGDGSPMGDMVSEGLLAATAIGATGMLRVEIGVEFAIGSMVETPLKFPVAGVK